MYSESRCQKVNLLRAAIVYYHYYKYGICAVGRRRAALCIADKEWSAFVPAARHTQPSAAGLGGKGFGLSFSGSSSVFLWRTAAFVVPFGVLRAAGQ